MLSVGFVVAVALWAVPPWAGAVEAASEISVEMKFAKGLQKHRPVDEGTTFEPAKVYAWTLIQGGQGTFTIHHVWYKNDRKVHRQTIQVRGRKYPTWSFVHVTAGSWKVDVTDENDRVLASGTFTVVRK